MGGEKEGIGPTYTCDPRELWGCDPEVLEATTNKAGPAGLREVLSRIHPRWKGLSFTDRDGDGYLEVRLSEAQRRLLYQIQREKPELLGAWRFAEFFHTPPSASPSWSFPFPRGDSEAAKSYFSRKYWALGSSSGERPTGELRSLLRDLADELTRYLSQLGEHFDVNVNDELIAKTSGGAAGLNLARTEDGGLVLDCSVYTMEARHILGAGGLGFSFVDGNISFKNGVAHIVLKAQPPIACFPEYLVINNDSVRMVENGEPFERTLRDMADDMADASTGPVLHNTATLIGIVPLASWTPGTVVSVLREDSEIRWYSLFTRRFSQTLRQTVDVAEILHQSRDILGEVIKAGADPEKVGLLLLQAAGETAERETRERYLKDAEAATGFMKDSVGVHRILRDVAISRGEYGAALKHHEGTGEGSPLFHLMKALLNHHRGQGKDVETAWARTLSGLDQLETGLFLNAPPAFTEPLVRLLAPDQLASVGVHMIRRGSYRRGEVFLKRAHQQAQGKNLIIDYDLFDYMAAQGRWDEAWEVALPHIGAAFKLTRLHRFEKQVTGLMAARLAPHPCPERLPGRTWDPIRLYRLSVRLLQGLKTDSWNVGIYLDLSRKGLKGRWTRSQREAFHRRIEAIDDETARNHLHAEIALHLAAQGDRGEAAVWARPISTYSPLRARLKGDANPH